MEKRTKQVSDKDLFVGKMIPNDLITEIFTRLPAKSVARFRCLSKKWASILERRQFKEMFMTVSSTRPRLLFALEQNDTWFFFSTLKPLNPDKDSSPLTVDYHKPFPSYVPLGMCAPVHGLICTNSVKPIICNPSTGEWIPLPKAAEVGSQVITFFGYDPINKTFKVLSLYHGVYRVLTFRSGKMSWRKIECSMRQYPPSGRNWVCINGVVYYLATGEAYQIIVVCFDIRSEMFKFLLVDSEMKRSTLINCKGRLGAVRYNFPITDGGDRRMELFVLDDADEEKWSKHIYVLPPLPPLWRDLSPKNRLRIVGMTCTGEIVLSSRYTLSNPFSIFYYNLERNTLVRVEIELGFVASKSQKIYIFIDHIENVKLMEMLRASIDSTT